MSGQDGSRLAVELDLLVDTDVDLCEVALVEVALKHLTFYKHIVLLKFLAGAKDEPSGVELLVLRRDGLSLLGVLSGEVGDVGVQIGHLLVELSNMDILLVEFLTQSLELLVFLLHLLRQVVDDLLQLSTLHAALANLLLELVNEFLVLFHDRLDELEVLLDTLGGVGTLALLGKRHTILGLSDFAEAFFNVTQRGHHVVDLIVFLGDNLLEGVALLLSCFLCFLHTIITTT